METAIKNKSVMRKSKCMEKTHEIPRRFPPRGCYEPVRICHLLETLILIMEHPDRKKLIKEFFKED